MAIKELKREWSPEQLDYVKHYLLHWEKDVKDLPACCVGSRATVSETDHEYVCTAECGWVREEYKELVSICPEILADPDVKILYKPGVTEIAAQEYQKNTDFDVAYFPDVVTIGHSAFESSNVRYAIFPKATMVQSRAFFDCENLKYAVFPSLVEAQRSSFFGTGIIHADFPALETIGNNMGATFSYCESLVNIDMPKLKSAYAYGSSEFSSAEKLTNVNLPELECVTTDMFRRCSALTKLDLPKATSVGRYAFEKSGIETLILRSETVATLDYTNAFTNTPIASGTGYIYVPSALIEDYKVATNWSTYAAQFRAIEDYPEICDPDWDGHMGDVIIPAGKSLTLESGATLVDGNTGANQMLVTDANGKMEWQERPVYKTTEVMSINDLVGDPVYPKTFTTVANSGLNMAEGDFLYYQQPGIVCEVVFDGVTYSCVVAEDGSLGAKADSSIGAIDFSEYPFVFPDPGAIITETSGEHTIEAVYAHIVERKVNYGTSITVKTTNDENKMPYLSMEDVERIKTALKNGVTVILNTKEPGNNLGVYAIVSGATSDFIYAVATYHGARKCTRTVTYLFSTSNGTLYDYGKSIFGNVVENANYYPVMYIENKYYKITISDDGTLTATEVTE